MNPEERAVYLTFDDGPIPEATPFILDMLARYGIKATFFMVGDNVRKYPELFRRVVAEGHRVGNHTFNHIGGLRWLSKNYLANTMKTLEIMEEAYGDADRAPLEASILPPLFRPPHGWMRGLQYLAIRRQGYTIVMWDLVTRDYSRNLTADEVYANVRQYARPGSIITFHDSLRSIDKLKKVLAPSLEWLQGEGYAFKTI